MKKIILSAAMMLAAVSFANAQWFIGGSVGVQTTKNNEDASITNYYVSPRFGYILNEKWMLGLGLGYTGTVTKSNGLKINTNFFNFAPYARYTACELGRFSLAFEGDILGMFGQQKAMNSDKIKKSRFGVQIAPVVQFDLSERVLLESRFGFASLGYQYDQTKMPDGQKSTSNTFVFGFDSDDAFTMGDITVGFIVKF